VTFARRRTRPRRAARRCLRRHCCCCRHRSVYTTHSVMHARTRTRHNVTLTFADCSFSASASPVSSADLASANCSGGRPTSDMQRVTCDKIGNNTYMFCRDAAIVATTHTRRTLCHCTHPHHVRTHRYWRSHFDFVVGANSVALRLLTRNIVRNHCYNIVPSTTLQTLTWRIQPSMELTHHERIAVFR
jgi:hypothetical protein